MFLTPCERLELSAMSSTPRPIMVHTVIMLLIRFCLQTSIPMLGSCLRDFIVNHLIEKVDVAILDTAGVTHSQRRFSRLTRLSVGDPY